MKLATDLMNKANLCNKIISTTRAPDHSLILWTFTVEFIDVKEKKTVNRETIRYEKYDRTVPETFLKNNIDTINSYIRDLEQTVETQDDLNNVKVGNEH